jgi:K319-like protein
MDRTRRLRGVWPRRAARQIAAGRRMMVAPLIAGFFCAGAARAQQKIAPTPGFDVLGFIQAATVDPNMCPELNPLLWGGTVTVNGITMTVPCNTILQMPAAAFTWSQIFDTSSLTGLASIAEPVNSTSMNGGSQPVGQTGLALSDTVGSGGSGLFPYPSFEIRAVGNVVKDATGKDQYIVGLIAPISQQGLNIGSGKIACIDYAAGFLYVGGAAAAPGQACSAANGARVQINDPVGRWGLPHSPDPRFTGDTGNTTIHAATGYPMCVPRTDPTVADDPLCPRGNRPLNGDPRFPVDPFLAMGEPLKAFNMRPPPGQDGADPSGFPDSRQQLPFMVGDWIDYSGTLAKDPVGQDYISAHTINANLGVFTSPGSQPAYVGVEVILLGTSGVAPEGILQEATNRIFIVGFTTDPTRLIDINAVDVNPCTGEETLRLLGTVDPASQPVRSRFRFHVLGGAFMPPTREMEIVSYTGTTPAVNPDGTPGYANGLGSGRYRLPDFDFIFPENQQFGQPILANNFQDLPFLAQGSGPLFGSGPIVGQLKPWPGNPVPQRVTCTVDGAGPLVTAGPDFFVGTNAPVTLWSNITQDPNAGWPTIQWTQTAGPLVQMWDTDTMTPGFAAPAVALTDTPPVLTFQITVTDAFGTASASVNVTVLPTTDSFTLGTAIWKFNTFSIHKVGQKGGVLNVTVTDSVIDPNISLYVVGFGPMIEDPILGRPNYFFKATGVNPPPMSVIVRSNFGGSIEIPMTFK